MENKKISTVRVLGVMLKAKKKAFVALQGIYGIGKKNVFNLCEALKIDPHARMYDIKSEVWLNVKEAINKLGYLIEGDLRSFVVENKKAERSIRSFKSLKQTKKSTSSNKSKFKKK